MRAWWIGLVVAFGATGAQAQLGFGAPFGAYEPTPAFLLPSKPTLPECSAKPLAYPPSRDARRGAQPFNQDPAPDPNCPAR
jgi:hypothetical protein